MNNLGCTSWPATDSVPFIFVTKKGPPNILDTLVQGSNPMDTISLSAILSNINCPLEVSEIRNSSSTVLFPNPTHDYFTINHSGDLKLYDAMGRLLKEDGHYYQMSSINYQFDAGIYFVVLNDGRKVFTQKLMIK